MVEKRVFIHTPNLNSFKGKTIFSHVSLKPNMSKITSNVPNKQGKVFLQLWFLKDVISCS